MDYKEHPEQHIDLIPRLLDRFDNTGNVMGTGQREMYEAIAPYCLGRIVFDIGCGLGIGTNILAQHARFVWGLDLNKRHIDFATKMYANEKIRFDEYDLLNNTPRELSKAHIVTCVEVIEHVEDYQAALDGIKRFMKDGTVLFISTPNRNSPTLQKDTPKNPYHVREWPLGEFYDVMIKNFESVTLYKHDLSDKVDLDSEHTPIVASCLGAIKNEG